MDRRLRWLGLAAGAAAFVALVLVLFVAREADPAMGGQLQRIYYVHVPSAWFAYVSFAIVFIASIAYLRTRARRWDLLAHAAAETGVVLASLVLITGPIWARPVWGTWWEWDARLTSTLVLWLTYIGYLLVRGLARDSHDPGRLAAVVGVVGFLDVPIVHFSVQWWRTLHPQGPTLADPSRSSGLGPPEQIAFLAALAAFALVFAWLLAARVHLGRLADDVERLELDAARARDRSPGPGVMPATERV